MSDVNQFKAAAAEAAAAQLRDGMVIGLGTGSTAAFAVDAVGRRVAQGLHVIAIPTSEHTAQQARDLNIPLATLGEHERIDITIDGADEVQLATLDLIKGHGGALFREKVIAASSTRLVIIVDESKLVDRLGIHFPVPVEIAQFGWQATERRVGALNSETILRMNEPGAPFVTDGGNYILDCKFGPTAEPHELNRLLNGIVGVVEHGLFLGMTSQVVVGSDAGVRVLERKQDGKH